MRESTKASQECLNRITAGEISGTVQSSAKGNGTVTGAVPPRGDPDAAPVERTPGNGAEKVDIGI